MYENGYSIPLKGSISAKSDNLAILTRDSLVTYAIVGSYSIHLVKGNNFYFF